MDTLCGGICLNKMSENTKPFRASMARKKKGSEAKILPKTIKLVQNFQRKEESFHASNQASLTGKS